jgi:hypothetical protein
MRVPLPERGADGSYTTGKAPMRIDGDGANGQSSVPVYAPAGWGPTLDYLGNAGGPGNWYGVVTHSGQKDGNPVRQTKEHPKPGAYVSATSYRWTGYSRGDPRSYVDSNAVPYLVLPGHWRAAAQGIVCGCRSTITDTETGRVLECGAFDFGPRAKLGEASIAAARFFGVPSSPKNGGTERARFVYRFWPGVPAVVNGVTYPLLPV